MLRDTLKALDRDAQRLLFVGAMAARSDSELDAKKRALAPVAPKAPAIAKITKRIENVEQAPGKSAASALLNLAAHMTQVSGALAEPAKAEGELVALPPAEPVESPLAPTELASLVAALTAAPEAKQRPRMLRDAIERGAVRDLRLLPYCVAALADNALSAIVEDKLLPTLGQVVVPELRATLNLQGKVLDARKLRVLARIQGEASKSLLIEACEKGSAELRAAGIERLSAMEPQAAEPIALRLVASDRSLEVKKLAAEALGVAKSDAALEALLAAFFGPAELREYAARALGRLEHPDTTARVLGLCTEELMKLAPFKPDPKAKKTEKDKAQRAHWDKVLFFSKLLEVLASRKDESATEMVLEVFRKHKVKEVKGAAARALLKSGYEGAFDELAPSVYEADWDTRSEFIDSILTREPERAFERLGRFLDPSSLKTKNHVAFAQNILDRLEGEFDAFADPEDEEGEKAPSEERAAKSTTSIDKDPRWIDAAIALLDHKELAGPAIDVLAHLKSPRVFDALLKLATSSNKGHHGSRLVYALVEYKDARVIPLLARQLEVLSGYWSRRTVYYAMRRLDDPALVPILREWATKKKLDRREKDELEGVVTFLERDRSLSAGV